MLTVWSRQSRRKRPANMNNRRRPNDGSGLVEGLLKRPAVQQGCVYGTYRSPCDVLHTGCSHYTYTLGVTFYIQVGGRSLRASLNSTVGFHIHFGVGFYNFRDQNFVYPLVSKKPCSVVKRAAGDVCFSAPVARLMDRNWHFRMPDS